MKNSTSTIKSLLGIYLILLPSFSLFSQETKTIYGRIVDEKNKPLSHANIHLLKSKTGAITNNEGRFGISLLHPEDSLVASSVGYHSYISGVSRNTSELRIQLKQAPIELSEVIVTNKTAVELIKNAIAKIPDNYQQEPFLSKIYYRGRISEKDTLLYFEETAFNVVKSYNKSFNDKYFLLKNRNFKLTSKSTFLKGIGNFDVVKHASKWFDSSFFRKYQATYLPGTSINERPTFVIEISSKSNEDIKSKIYIDAEDLAFVRFVINEEDGDRTETQYLKMDGKYYMMNGYRLHLNKHIFPVKSIIPAEADMITTAITHSFAEDSIEGIPVNTEDILQGYATQNNDTVFWKKHGALLSDRKIQEALTKYNLERTKSTQDSILKSINRLYTPQLRLIVSSDIDKDLSSMNRNSISTHLLAYHLLQKNIRSRLLGLLASFTYYSISNTVEEAFTEKTLLNINGIKPKMNIFGDLLGESYLHNLSDNVMQDYKSKYYNDFMRLHTLCADGHFAKSIAMEEEIAKVDLSNRNNLIDYLFLYSYELLAHKISLIYNPWSKNVKAKNTSSEKQPLLIDRNQSWAKYLYEPETDYKRHIEKEDLTRQERNYLKRSAFLSWINLISPQLIGINRIHINKDNEFTFSLNYLRAPFGEMFQQNFWLINSQKQLHGIFLRQYRTRRKTDFGIGYKLYNVKVMHNTYLTSTLDLWRQPANFQFRDTKFKSGIHIAQMLEYQCMPDRYTHRNKLSFSIGYDYKTQGYLPQSYYLGSRFNVKAGFAVLFQ
jgi:hypothetical protein